jgi:hypothetical protein
LLHIGASRYRCSYFFSVTMVAPHPPASAGASRNSTT